MSVRRSSALVLAVLAAGLSGLRAPAPAHADPLAVVAGEALDVTADKLDVDVGQGSALLEGHVQATLGDLVVRCPKVEVRYDAAPRVKSARGSGGVTATLKDIEASASVVEVDAGRGRVTLLGDVQLRRGKGWVKADRASIDLATRKVSLEDVKGSIPVERPASK